MKAYVVGHPLEIRPGRPDRRWMDESHNRTAYRCLPLSIANSFGWEIILPERVIAHWNGGSSIDSVLVQAGGKFASAHFGHGVLTFHTGYLFRTDPGVQLMVRGAPNWEPRGPVMALEGLVETDWLSFTFTMNWKFLYPGTVYFEPGDPICFITPVRVDLAQSIQPEVMKLDDAPEEAKRYRAYAERRNAFNADLKVPGSEADQQKWQRFYHRGEHADGSKAEADHLSKLRLKNPILRVPE